MVVAGGATAQQSRVFVSSTSSDGNLGGLVGADATCNSLATAAGLGGNWVAWLSTSTVNAVDRLTPGSGPFVRATDTATIIANDIPDLTDGNLQNSVALTESGSGPPSVPWTGTATDGTLFVLAQCSSQPAGGCACNDWSAPLPDDGRRGDHTATLGPWTDASNSSCTRNTRTLYCFELPGFCGDGNIDTGEDCDDGNTTSGDGCSAMCMTEVPTLGQWGAIILALVLLALGMLGAQASNRQRSV
jgi:cysteine-rich repeat protein